MRPRQLRASGTRPGQKRRQLAVVDLLEAFFETIQVDMTLFARVQSFPEPSNSCLALIFGLAGCHVQRKIVIEHPALFKGA